MSEVEPRYGRRQFLKRAGATAGALTFGGALAACGSSSSSGGGQDIKVGGLIPFTGIETHNGKAMQYGLEIAVAEVNGAGGLAGGKAKVFLADDGAQVDQGVQKAQELITQKQVDVIIGTLLSNVRAAVFDVTKKSNTMFMNPTFYEGKLCSKLYFSAGAPPNQTIDPLAAYAMKHLGKSVYFIASDYVWGTGSTAAAKAAVQANGGKIAGSPRFVPLGTTDFSAEIRRIQSAKPDIVWPFVAGQDGITFLKQLTDAGVRSDVKIVADYIDELIVPALSPETYTGIVNSATYFMALDNPENKAFLGKLRSRYGQNARISSFGMEMYNNMKLLGVAAKDLKSWDDGQVAQKVAAASFTGPGGNIAFNATDHYATQDVHIAEIQKDASFKIVLSEKNVKPKPGCAI
jgi:urea transport system substrate-binding protein